MRDEAPGPAEWVALAMLCGCGVLSALLEMLFLAEFYVGTIIVPVVVLAALGGNVLLPFWGFRLVHAARGAVLPVVFWLITILGLSLYTPPEGDLFVINAYHQQGAFYGLLLVGAIAGFATIVVVSGRATMPPPPRPTAKGPRVNR